MKNRESNKIQKIVMTAMLASFACVATMIIKIPSPLGGYINLGDCIVLLSAWVISPLCAFFAAALGSALADALGGYMAYVPATFIIKGLMAIVACFVFRATAKKLPALASRIIAGILAELEMIGGYLVFESFLYGFVPSLVNVPANAVQGAVGVVLGILLKTVFEKNKLIMK